MTIPSQYLDAINGVLQAEGGYVNNPADRGGETNFGITKTVWRANGYNGPVEQADINQARDIYYGVYIVIPGFDRICQINYAVGMKLIDIGVNMGVKTAGEFLQRSLNGFNNSGAPDLTVDGNCGQATRDALTEFSTKRGAQGSKCLVAVITGLQAAKYLAITENNKIQRQFFYGWVNGRVLK